MKAFGVHMIENPPDHRRILYAGNHLDRPAAGPTGLDVDLEHPFESLRPAHRGVAFGGRTVLRFQGR